MLLDTYFGDVELHREEKAVHVKFAGPCRVASTCPGNGGVRDDILVVFNQQSCEPKGHHSPGLKSAGTAPESHHRDTCERLGFPPGQSVSLGTAANMNNLGRAAERFEDLEVVGLATGGVETNAGRAGDPAGHHERDGRTLKVEADEDIPHGTINTIVLINRTLTKGASVRAVMMATEAKTAVLQELAVNSRYSEGLATGTGTDQIAVASRLGDEHPLRYAGKHCKLGELIARAVQGAIRETLLLQNGLTPQRRCSVLGHLDRFGLDREGMVREVARWLNEQQARLFTDNIQPLDNDPATVAAVAALVHLRDKLAWGILPQGCLPEILAGQAAQVAAAVSGKFDRLATYREALAGHAREEQIAGIARFALRALALGFRDKWEHLA